ncbi:DUF4252 domain-containing protein [Galbibacter sp. EGI 63066]|uniref:DUF4252 domain-containing protein n=1 Tax=Galbibacter sp. EGI 63066 TaxID=2993559 RepID=UPI0022498C7F|nr:DUF4252 domain-containing protein [Galbibacter sp. EGI 63066]MCX2678536.1 DUF4252 domain-containing protein [Galbibacter sp. EGI 63066]
MKKIFLIIALAALPFMSYSQSIFDKYESDENVTFVSLQPKMFQMLSKINVSTNDPDAQEVFDLVENITSFKVITTEKANITKDIDSWVSNHLQSSNFEELMRVRDGESNVKFYVKEGKDENHVRELLMFVTDLNYDNVEFNGKKPETVLLLLTGNIDLRKISKLTQNMDLPGGDQLGKAEGKQ